jgi:dTDP-glucose pyrophosphorylase
MAEKYPAIAELCVTASDSIQEAARRMDKHRLGIVLIVDKSRRLLGTITDGDLRRALLSRTPPESPVRDILARKRGSRFAKPISAPAGAAPETYVALFRKHKIHHLPLLDAAGRVSGFAARTDLLTEAALPVRAVLMAGGKGTRLMPLTRDTPKPMLRIGDKPLIEIIIGQLKDAGISKVQIATHHQREKISGHFDGKQLGVDLSYLQESSPLGTAGALGLIDKPRETMLVMNSDLLTKVDFGAMLKYHREMKAELTAAVCQYDFHIPYGVVECAGHMIREIKEKPSMAFFVCAGIYLVEPSALKLIPKGRRSDMTDLIGRLVGRKRRVVSFPIREYWLDIGRPDDYLRAQKDAASWHAPAAERR